MENFTVNIDHTLFRSKVQIESYEGCHAKDGFDELIDEYGSEAMTDEQWDVMQQLRRHGLALQIQADGTIIIPSQPNDNF